MQFHHHTLLIVLPFVAVWVGIQLALRYAFAGTSYWPEAFLTGFLTMVASGMLLAYFTGGLPSTNNRL